MKPAYFIALLALPLSLFACAKATTAGSGGGGEGGEGGEGGQGGANMAASSSSGMPGPCVMQADCVAFNDSCNIGNCINGVCVKTPANDGAGCDDGLYCTEGDTCVKGVCTGASEKFCPSTEPCHVGQCNEATKLCDSVPGNNGMPCVDDDPCTGTGSCQGGVCAGGPPVDCSFLNGTCSKGVCDPQLGCVTQPVNDGTACDDKFYCTVNDVCKNGVCAGEPNTCAAPGDVCKIGMCNEAQKSCVAVPGNDGAQCEDGNPCTAGSTCSSGSCVGGQAANEGMMCDDGDACTSGTTCSSGACTNASSVISMCVNGDQCCPANCAMQDDDCSITKWSEGTMAWPDQACNPFNSFGSCDTNAQVHADAWATRVCMNNGYSMGIWTGNKQGGCTGDISMYCNGGSIPCIELYEFMCFASDQTKVEITCFP